MHYANFSQYWHCGSSVVENVKMSIEKNPTVYHIGVTWHVRHYILYIDFTCQKLSTVGVT